MTAEEEFWTEDTAWTSEELDSMKGKLDWYYRLGTKAEERWEDMREEATREEFDMADYYLNVGRTPEEEGLEL